MYLYTGVLSQPYRRRLTLCLLITTIVAFNMFYQPIKSQLLIIKCVFKHYCKGLVSNYKVLLTVYMSILTYWSFYLFLFFYFFLCGASRLYVRLSLSHEFEQFGSLHMCAPESYRTQRDSNPVPPGSESTTLPMSYPGATNMSNFQPLDIVNRGSETQYQVVENLNKITSQDKG